MNSQDLRELGGRMHVHAHESKKNPRKIATAALHRHVLHATQSASSFEEHGNGCNVLRNTVCTIGAAFSLAALPV